MAVVCRSLFVHTTDFHAIAVSCKSLVYRLESDYTQQFFIRTGKLLRHSKNGGQKGKEGRVDPKQHGGEWLKVKGKQLGGSHGRMSEPSQQTVVGGKRMSKPYVPYGIKRYRYRYGKLGVEF